MPDRVFPSSLQQKTKMIYIDHQLITSGGHFLPNFYKVKAVFSKKIYKILVPINSSVTLDDNEILDRVFPGFFSERNIAKKVMSKFSAWGLSYVAIVMHVCYEIVCSLFYMGSYRRALKRFDGDVFISDPTLASLICLCFFGGSVQNLYIYYVIYPLSDFNVKFHLKNKVLSMLMGGAEKIFKDRMVVFYDDYRMERALLGVKNKYQFPYIAPDNSSLDCANNMSESRIYVPGFFFPAKGYGAFLNAISKIEYEFFSRNNIKIYIRAPDYVFADLPDKIRRDIIVQLVSLNYCEYINQIRSSDLICMFYNPLCYSPTGSSSGVLREALYYDKVVLTTNHTWMSECLERYGTGPFLLTEFDEENLIKCIKLFYGNRESYRGIYRCVGESFKEHENSLMEGVVDIINRRIQH